MSTRTGTFSTRTHDGRDARKSLVTWMSTFLAVWQERRKLERLDDHILRDIGKSRGEVDAETSRRAWDAPSRWLR